MMIISNFPQINAQGTSSFLNNYLIAKFQGLCCVMSETTPNSSYLT